MFSLSIPGRLGVIDPEALKKKKSEKKSPEKKTAYKKFLLYCKELESKYPFIEECFSKWIQEIPIAGFKPGTPLEKKECHRLKKIIFFYRHGIMLYMIL